jgi:hypothetical protein
MKLITKYQIMPGPDPLKNEFLILRERSCGPAVAPLEAIAICGTEKDALMIIQALTNLEPKAEVTPTENDWRCAVCNTKHNARPRICTYCGVNTN